MPRPTLSPGARSPRLPGGGFPLPGWNARRAFAAAAGAVAALALCASCRSVEGTTGVPPFWETYDSPSSEGWLGDRPGSETFLRPFGSFERAGDRDERLKFLLPVGEFHWGPEETRYTIYPIFRRQSLRRNAGTDAEEIDLDAMIFPFFFWGDDPEEGAYFAFFPFGGSVKGLFAQDRIDFALFPLWTRLTWREKVSTHILWPFFNTVSGGGWSGGRFWPFYGAYQWLTEDGELRSERRFTLWPFWIREREHLHRDPTEITFSFPFYGRRENSRSLTTTYFWPLWIHHYDKKHDRNLSGGYFFPYRFTEGQRDYWPIFGTKSETEAGPDGYERRRYRQFAVWPIQRYDWIDEKSRETARTWILPFWFDVEVFHKQSLRTERRTKLWPLVGYRRSGDDVAVDVLSPLWTNREDLDRAWGRLFAVFRSRSDAAGNRWELFWGTLYWESGKAGALFSILGGLVEVGRHETSWSLELCYLPLLR